MSTLVSQTTQDVGFLVAMKKSANNGLQPIFPGFLLGMIAGVVSPLGVEYLKLHFFSPIIDLKFDAKSPYVISTVVGSDQTREYFSFIEFRFLLENTSKYSTAKNYSVMLKGLWKEKEGSFIPYNAL